MNKPMTDKQWAAAIKKCRAAGDEHNRLLEIAENEYVRRYGHHPSDVDDDYWIDALHICTGSIDVKMIMSSAELNK